MHCARQVLSHLIQERSLASVIQRGVCRDQRIHIIFRDWLTELDPEELEDYNPGQTDISIRKLEPLSASEAACGEVIFR